MADLTRTEITKKIIVILKEFSDFSQQNKHHRNQMLMRNADQNRKITHDEQYMQDMLRKLNNDALVEMYKKCGDLAEKYSLRSKGTVKGYNAVVLIPEIRGRWQDNGNGTFTALEGAALWDLYGSTWREQSGYTGDPARLRPGTVVGRNNSIIFEYESGWGNQIKNIFGEKIYNTVGEFVLEKLAYPAKQIGMGDVKELFDEIGIELEEKEEKAGEPETELAEMPWYLLEGGAVHFAIGAKYMAEHKSEETRTNTYPISSILKVFEDLHKVQVRKDNETKGDLRKRPDITNITNYHLYEIKPNHADGLKAAKTQRDMYLSILNEALITGKKVVPGPRHDGSAKGYVDILNSRYKYDSPEDGVILYKKVGEPKPRPVPHPIPVAVPGKVLEQLMESVEPKEIACVSGLIFVAATILSRMVLRLVPGGYIFLLPNFQPPAVGYGLNEPQPML